MAGRINLLTEVQFVRGVGPYRAKLFGTLGVSTVGDLLEYLPFRYELRPKSIPIGSLTLGAVATIVGELARVRTQGRFARTSISAEIVDGTGRCRARWFNSPFLVDRLRAGQVVRLTGKVEQFRDDASFSNPQLTVFEPGGDPMEGDVDRLDPVYPGSAALSGAQIARIIDGVLEDAADQIEEPLPEFIRTRRSLPLKRAAILRCHKPTSQNDVSVARRRLAYDELFLCQLAVQLSRRRRALGPAAQTITTSAEVDRRIRGRMPFTLTPGQDRAVEEIVADLARSAPMNRLLQGDVGAGKTAVAVYAALTTIANGRQVVLLAPTEVLAAQHRGKFEHYLAGSRVRTTYLAGSTPRTARRDALAKLRAGEVDLAIGTHALLERDVRFRNLGLVIIDEQHKFGVAQRAALRAKGRAPHTLVLTATPIPRTLAMTVFGELDISTIDGAPPNRQPIVTRMVREEQTDEAWAFVRSRLKRGEQAYVVYPLVEESETLDLKAAGVEVERLAGAQLAGHRLGLLHGRMKPSEKADVMQRFREGEISVLVATTVIEVGVDVAGATVMVVQHAERYGLSQLHQLRGRIGRGSKKSYCLLFTDVARGPAAERLDVLCQTTDGFRIAEEDLRIRGPGELLGKRQHGLPEFKVANLVTDFDLLQQARQDAAEVLRGNDDLAAPEYTLLKKALLQRHGEALKLFDVG